MTRITRQRTVFVSILILIAALATAGAQRASAVTAGDWKAGNIISDANFYDGNAMAAADVQNFLSSKGAACVAGEMPCLKNYSMATPAIQSEAGICGAMAASGGLNAAQIIDRVARACGISQKIILVTLQKESGLVTKTRPTATNYRSATGFGCPDTAPCDAQYYGFFNQVYRMARQFKVYTANPTRYGYQKGRNNTIQYNPNAGCGSASVYIENQATANLYIYTPYQPNGAALANMNGAGDSCSAYGNRNFWRFYNDWFGAPAPQNWPLGNLESVTSSGANVTLKGWAFDPDSAGVSSKVAVYRNGEGTSWYPADQLRQDVNAAYGISGNHGFNVTVPAQPGGTFSYCVYAIDNEGMGNPSIGCATVTVTPPRSYPPVGNLESVSADYKAVSIVGWSIDPDALGTQGNVAVYRNGVGINWFPTDKPRQDINTAFGATGNHGFSIGLSNEPIGDNTYCVMAIDIPGVVTNPLLGCVKVHVKSPPIAPPVGNFEAASVTSQTVSLTGWAYDPDNPGTPSNIAVYRNGVGISWYPTAVARADVNGSFGVSGNHGFNIKLAQEPLGANTYCVFAVDVQGVTVNPLLGCQTVTVTSRAPVANLESAVGTPGAASFVGWAYDPDGPNTSISVALYRDGEGLAWYLANTSRTDVNNAYSITGAHGFNINLADQPPGTHTYCLFAIDESQREQNPLFACRAVTT